MADHSNAKVPPSEKPRDIYFINDALWTYRARLYRIMDGDTYYLEIDTGFESRHVVRVRLPRANAPELGTPEGDTSRTWAHQWFEIAQNKYPKDYWYLRVRTMKAASRYEGETQDRSLERYIGEVYDLDGKVLSVALVENGMAKYLDLQSPA